ncbi:MAG: DNA replication/repair protein RecF [Firmicutes bacterium]|nr:DNA replication/repair protein RecF [Bacillota bacterium]
MKITQLTLRNFRNYQHCHLDLHPGLNILVGRNAQGKTNLLESVYFLSTGRSHRTSNHYDLIRWDTTGVFLHARISKRNLKVELDFSLSRDRRRQLKINGVVEKKLSALLGVLNSVLFTPEDLQLLKGPPALRRRFLDMEVSQVSPVYLYTLQQYNRALTQRNNLLKSFENRSVNRAVLETWNEQLIKYGARLTILRQRALAALAKHAKPSLYTISSGEENLCLVYRPWGYKIDLGDKEEEVSAAFREILERQYHRELRRKQTLVGPHRDDFQCLLNGIDVREFGSQGQQRSAVLAIKMAELEFMHEMTGDYPVLLLDDVLSELDSRRRRALLGLVDQGVQTLITGTEASLFTGWQDKSLLIAEISNGIISIVN